VRSAVWRPFQSGRVCQWSRPRVGYLSTYRHMILSLLSIRLHCQDLFCTCACSLLSTRRAWLCCVRIASGERRPSHLYQFLVTLPVPSRTRLWLLNVCYRNNQYDHARGRHQSRAAGWQWPTLPVRRTGRDPNHPKNQLGSKEGPTQNIKLHKRRRNVYCSGRGEPKKW
jgi:hypothetical protein